MNERERLIELLNDIQRCGEDYTEYERFGINYPDTVSNENVADYLLSQGVTVQRWIPVTERLPYTIPCGAGWAFSEAVNVLTTGRKVLTAIWDGTDFIADAEFWEVDGEEITHWASVPLPLPEPSKEE